MHLGLVQKTVILMLSFAGLDSSTLLSQTPPQSRSDINAYIHNAWGSLERSTNDCNSVVDPKVASKPLIYLPAGMKEPEDLEGMQKKCGVEVRHLPKAIRRLGDVRPTASLRPGLLYLPNPYVVPGGRFNEMYGWDSYFIVLGLIGDGRASIAKGIVENFFFEIANYGAVLNANRTYFLTRSQPPLLSSLIAEVYGKTHDAEWLRSAYSYAESDYALWTAPDHRAGNTGLARYFDLGAGPVPEMADDSTYYPMSYVGSSRIRSSAAAIWWREANIPTKMRLVGYKLQVAMCSLRAFVRMHTPTASVSRLPFTEEIEPCVNLASIRASALVRSADRLINTRLYVSTVSCTSMNAIWRHSLHFLGSSLNLANGSEGLKRERKPSLGFYGTRARVCSATTTFQRVKHHRTGSYPRFTRYGQV